MTARSVILDVLISMSFMGVCVQAKSADPDAWNLIAIVTDDQAYWAVGANGNDEIVTPNMDRLAREGARFTNYFVTSAVCTPSRATYLTGLYSQQSGLHDVSSRRDRYEGLSLGVPAWTRVLQANGYATGLVGKWHLGRTVDFHPTRFGIDHFFGFLSGANRPMDPILERDGERTQFEGSLPDILVDDAIRFVERNRDRPFGLMLHFRAPHAPHGPVPPEDTAPYEDLVPTVPIVDPAIARMDDDQEPPTLEAIAVHEKDLRHKMRTYYASVHSVDRNIGRVMETLESLGLDERTIVVFTSDNGFMFGHRGLKGKALAQPIWNHTLLDNIFVVNMFEDSARVPLIVRWPGVVEPGTVIDELVLNVDIYPSYLGMLGLRAPEEYPMQQGLDFSKLLRGHDVRWREVSHADYTPDQTGNIEYLRMARTKRWKLVRACLNPGLSQLFDLENDPAEIRNLYVVRDRKIPPSLREDAEVNRKNTPHQIQLELEARLREWQVSIEDPVLEMERIWNGAKQRNLDRWTPDSDHH